MCFIFGRSKQKIPLHFHNLMTNGGDFLAKLDAHQVIWNSTLTGISHFVVVDMIGFQFVHF